MTYCAHNVFIVKLKEVISENTLLCFSENAKHFQLGNQLNIGK